MRTVIAFGEVLFDEVGAHRVPGGAPFNVAARLARKGVDAWLLSAVGHDALGRALLAEVERRGVRHGVDTVAALETGKAVATVGPEGQVHFELLTPAAYDQISLTADLRTVARRADAAVYGTLALRQPHNRATCKELLGELRSAALRVCDLNLRPPHCTLDVVDWCICNSTHLKLNIDELEMVARWLGGPLVERGAERLAMEWLLARMAEGHGGRAVAVTRGADGACALDHAGEWAEVDGLAGSVVDTIGCGDAFTAAWTLAMLEGRPQAECVARGNAAGAEAAAHAGALSAE